MRGKRLLYMNAAELLDSVFDVYKKSFWPQLGLNMIANVILYAVFLILLFAGAIAMVGAILSNAPEPRMDGVWSWVPLVLGAAAFTIFIVSLWSAFYQATVLIASRLTVYEKKVDIGFVIKHTLRAFVRILTVVAAQLIVVFPFLALIGGVIAIVFTANNFSIQNFPIQTLLFWIYEPVNIILFSVSILLIMLFFSLLFNFFTLAIPVAVFQNKYFFGALVQSYLLIRGSFWKIAGVRIIFLLVVNSVSYSFWVISASLVAVIRTLTLSPFLMSLLTSFASFFQLVMSLLISLCITPLPNIFITMLYINQKIVKEGLDIDLGLSALEAAGLTRSVQVSDG